MPTTSLRDSGLTDGEIHEFIKSFDSIGDAFFFLGASTLSQVKDRARGRVAVERAEEPKTSSSPELDEPDAANAPNAPEARGKPERPTLRMPSGHKPVLLFDTETTGLSPAVVCQLAYLVVQDGSVTIEYDHLLKLPSGVRIGRKAQAVHGISNCDCAQRGVCAEDALELFAKTCARVLLAGGRVVAHNSKFDVRAIRETRAAHGVVDCGENQTLEVTDTFCTMACSKQYSPLKDIRGHRKQFKNDELYEFFYRSPPVFARLHNALDDVLVTALNYAEGLRLGWW